MKLGWMFICLSLSPSLDARSFGVFVSICLDAWPLGGRIHLFPTGLGVFNCPLSPSLECLAPRAGMCV